MSTNNTNRPCTISFNIIADESLFGGNSEMHIEHHEEDDKSRSYRIYLSKSSVYKRKPIEVCLDGKPLKEINKLLKEYLLAAFDDAQKKAAEAAQS